MARKRTQVTARQAARACVGSLGSQLEEAQGWLGYYERKGDEELASFWRAKVTALRAKLSNMWR